MKHFHILAIVNRTSGQFIDLKDLERLTYILQYADETADDNTKTVYDLIDILEQGDDRSLYRTDSPHAFDFRVYQIECELGVDVIIRDK